MKQDALTAIFLYVLVLFLGTPSAVLVFDFENPEQLNQLEVLRETDDHWKLYGTTIGVPYHALILIPKRSESRDIERALPSVLYRVGGNPNSRPFQFLIQLISSCNLAPLTSIDILPFNLQPFLKGVWT